MRLVELKIDSENYTAGEVVKATAFLHVKRPKEVANSELLMNFIGDERSHVRFHTDKNSNKRSESEVVPFFEVSNVVAKIGPEGLVAGTHEFKCDLILGDDYPSSFNAYHHGTTATIRYRAEAFLRIASYWNPDHFKEKVFFVKALPRVPQPHYLREKIFEADHQRVNLCCCYERGSMTMAGAISKQVVTRNDTLTSAFVVQNTSTIRVLKVQVTLWERYDFTADRRKGEITKFLSRQTFEPEEVFGLEEVAKVNEYLQVEDIKQELYERLISPDDSKKVIVTFNIRPNVTESFHGNLINKTHEVKTIVFTPDGYTDLEFVTPVEILPSKEEFTKDDPVTSYKGRPKGYVSKAIEVPIFGKEPMKPIKEDLIKPIQTAVVQKMEVTATVNDSEEKKKDDIVIEVEEPVPDVTEPVIVHFDSHQQEVEEPVPDVTEPVVIDFDPQQEEIEEPAQDATEAVVIDFDAHQQEVEEPTPSASDAVGKGEMV